MRGLLQRESFETFRWSPLRTPRLTSRLGHCHDFQQMAVRVFEVEATPATTSVDLAVGVVVGLAAVGEPFVLHPAKDRLKLCIADVERVMMTPAGPGIETRPTPLFCLVGEGEGQVFVDLHLREVA